MRDFSSSLWQSLRSLARRPGLAVTISMTLAVGIGATTAIFSVVDAVFLKPLPLPSPERLILIEEFKSGKSSNGNPQRLADWRAQLPGIESAGGFYTEKLVLTGRGDAERLRAMRTFGPVLSVLGVSPERGRGFTAEEERGAPVALLTDGYWHRGFGADPSILGQTLNLDGKPHTIVGILPAAFRYPAPPEVQRASRKASFLPTLARLKPGVSLAEAQSQIASVAERLRTQYPATDKDLTARAVPLLASETSEARTPVFAVLACVALVLLTACTNVAGLLLARAAERQKETAIRVSLGATRLNLAGLYFMESSILAFFGCLLGLALAAVGLDGLKLILPADLPRLGEASIDVRVAAFAVALSLGCALLFGVAPAWQASSSAKPRNARAFLLRRVMVAGQVALSFMLLIGAGLLGESFLQMKNMPLGFSPANVLTVNISFPWDAPDTRVEAFRAQALDAFSSIPGVMAAGWGDRLPLDGGTQSGPIAIRGRDLPPALQQEQTFHRAVSETYFQAIGIPLKAGRLFAQGKQEAVVNDALAKKFFPDGRALGSAVSFDQKHWFEIVGVVGDVRNHSMDQAAPEELYVSGANLSWPLSSFALRVAGDPSAAIPAVREAVRRIDPNQVIDSIATMESRLDAAYREPKLESWLIFGFALTALALTVLGIYGLMTSDVVQRTREIGVRIAVGARPAQVLAMIVRRGLITVIPGIATGIAAAAALTRFLASLLFGVSPFDATIFGATAAILIATGLLASYLPARRASTTDPVKALRAE
jgi:predicted permease